MVDFLTFPIMGRIWENLESGIWNASFDFFPGKDYLFTWIFLLNGGGLNMIRFRYSKISISSTPHHPLLSHYFISTSIQELKTVY